MVAMSGLAQCSSGGSFRYEVLTKARALLDQGKYDEALFVYCRWGETMGQDLVQRIESSIELGNKERALELSEVYLEYFPFGVSGWYGQSHKWEPVATRYLELREELGRGEGEVYAQDAIAVGLYHRIADMHEAYDEEEKMSLLVDELVSKCPKSLFCPAAIMSLGEFQTRKNGKAAGVLAYEKYLKKIKEAEAPKRSIALVTMGYAEALGCLPCAPDDKSKEIAAYQSAAKITGIGYEKLLSRLRAAEVYASLDDEESLAKARELFTSFLSDYPNSYESTRVRSAMVDSYLRWNEIEAAHEAVHKLAESSPSGTDLGRELHEVAKAHIKKEEYDKALAVLSEIVKDYPTDPNLSMANYEVGNVYEKLEKEDLMVAAYEKAALLDSKFDPMDLMTTYRYRNPAIVALAEYYMEQEEWEEALKYWEAWEPQSLCGTCRMNQEERKKALIEECREDLARKE